MGGSGTRTSGQADTVEEVGLGLTHPHEASIQHYAPSTDLEPAGQEEERRRDTEAELKQQGTSWTGMARAAQNSVLWRGFVDDLCSSGSDGRK